MSRNRVVGSIAMQPIGEWRSQLLWRLFGLFINQLCVMIFDQAGWWDSPHARTVPFIWLLYGCGLLLIATGPRLVLLAATSLSALASVVAIVANPAFQLAEEYLPLIVLPALGTVLGLLPLLDSRVRERKSGELSHEQERAQVSLFRVSVVVVMTLSAFHKLNADFFDPLVSCGSLVIPGRLIHLLPAQDLVWQVMPFVGFLGEALIPVLLLCLPRVGLWFALLAMVVIGHQGAMPFTLLVVVMSLSFLRAEDGAVIAAGWRLHKRLLASVLGGVFVASFLLFESLGTFRPGQEYALFETATLAIAVTLFHVSWSERAAWRDWLRPRLRAGAILPAKGLIRWVLVGLVLLSVADGLTPYLGLKYRFSFAMFSNLRVDRDRWNSYLIPQSVYLFADDPFVRVTDLKIVGELPESQASLRELLREGLYSPTQLKRTLAYQQQLSLRADFSVAYRSDSQNFAGASSEEDTLTWLAEIPEQGRLFQEYLVPGDRPQPCVH